MALAAGTVEFKPSVILLVATGLETNAREAQLAVAQPVAAAPCPPAVTGVATMGAGVRVALLCSMRQLVRMIHLDAAVGIKIMVALISSVGRACVVEGGACLFVLLSCIHYRECHSLLCV